ncbi:MAG: hypothetical protein VKO21_11060 [Candidatus Sericytochromatia bacterium]|nr:hypothetical protein [Candidatus Sericytochromatia bacterium]
MGPPAWSEGLLLPAAVVRRLDAALQDPHHAWLLVGAKGAGKLTTARRWARALLCERRVPGSACGPASPTTCNSCRRWDAGNHPDFHEFLPLPERKGVSIDQIAGQFQVKRGDGPWLPGMIPRLSVAAWTGGLQVHIVALDGISLPGVNAMLRVLEEPPSPCVIILLGSALSDILPTVVSRCQRVAFDPIDDDVLARWLAARGEGSSSDQALAVRRSAGRPGLALSALRGEGIPAAWDEGLGELLQTRDPIRRLQLLGWIQDWPGQHGLEAVPAHVGLVDEALDRLAEAWWWARTGHLPRSGEAKGVSALVQAAGGEQGMWSWMAVLLQIRTRLEAGVSAKNAWLEGAHHWARLPRRA